jgi:pimeloyl-ACP methyl ester carboxylesterase
MPLSVLSTQEIISRIGSTSGLIDVAGNQIYYEVAGNGLPIVFLHDGLLHSVGFDTQFEIFSENYDVIRYDRPGYGNSRPRVYPISKWKS